MANSVFCQDGYLNSEHCTRIVWRKISVIRVWYVGGKYVVKING